MSDAPINASGVPNKSSTQTTAFLASLNPSHPTRPQSSAPEEAAQDTNSQLERQAHTGFDGLLNPADAPSQCGRFQVVGVLGRGGMGAVLRVLDLDLGRNLAVKLLLSVHANEPIQVRRFLDEARITGRLQHPSVVPLHEMGTLSDGRPFFTMKLVEGRTLAELLAARTHLGEDLPRLVGIFEQIAQAVAYAHSKGVIHRDLKPANVMVGAFGEVQVMDWGLAKVLGSGEERLHQVEPVLSLNPLLAPSGPDSATQAGAVVGTVAYMPPEQARGQPVDERADVFGLGSILCEILTGLPPYADEMNLYAKVVTGQLEPAFARLESCGADRELIVLARACLQRDPTERLLHAGEVAQRVSAHRVGVEERLKQSELDKTRTAERRKRQGVVVAAAVLLLVGLLGGGSWFMWDRIHTLREVESALVDATILRQNERWAEAGEALKRAEAQIESLPESYRQQVLQARADLEFVTRLDAIRMDSWVEDNFTYLARRCSVLFEEHGLDLNAGTPQEVAEQINRKTVRKQLLTVLSEWALGRLRVPQNKGGADAQRLLAIAAACTHADVAEDRWRNEILTAAAHKDIIWLEKTSRNPDTLDQPPDNLLLLSQALMAQGRYTPATAFLRAAQQRHPANFWLNVALGRSYDFRYSERADQPIAYFRAAVALRPYSTVAREGLARALASAGLYEDALGVIQEALTRAPDRAEVHLAHGMVLAYSGDMPEAEAAMRKTLALRPKRASSYDGLGWLELARGRPTAAVPLLEKAIELRPDSAESHYYLGEAYRRLGQMPKAEENYRQTIQLLPEQGSAYRELVSLLRGQDRFEDALQEIHKWEAAGPDLPVPPTLIADTERMAQLRPRLDRVRQGQEQPADPPEKILFAEMCFERGLFPDAVRLFAEAFAANPALGEGRLPLRRFHAACAALAADKPNHALALKWLREELTTETGLLRGPKVSAEVANRLRDWRWVPEFQPVAPSNLRSTDTSGKQALPEKERLAWLALWKDVDAVIAQGLGAR